MELVVKNDYLIGNVADKQLHLEIIRLQQENKKLLEDRELYIESLKKRLTTLNPTGLSTGDFNLQVDDATMAKYLLLIELLEELI